jgi:hypothetical protein
MDDAQIDQHLSYYAARFPSLITLVQAAEIAQATLKTIYYWSSLQLFNEFKIRRGRHVRLTRDRFVRFFLTHGQ